MTATKVSPWQDNLRHLYEAGRDLETLARWHSLGKETVRRLIVEAGGTIRRPSGKGLTHDSR